MEPKLLFGNMMFLNEAAFLPVVIPILQEMVDVLVLQDNGSSDTSPFIASKLTRPGQDIYLETQQTNPPNYSELRNNMLRVVPDKAWVLKWDPDELPSKELMRLKEYLGDLDPDINLIGVPIYHLVDDLNALSIEYGFTHNRLFRKYPDTHFENSVHEQVISRGAIYNIPHSLNMAVMHLSYYNISRLRRKEEAYAEIPGSGHYPGTLERNIRGGVQPIPAELTWDAPKHWLEWLRIRSF